MNPEDLDRVLDTLSEEDLQALDQLSEDEQLEVLSEHLASTSNEASDSQALAAYDQFINQDSALDTAAKVFDPSTLGRTAKVVGEALGGKTARVIENLREPGIPGAGYLDLPAALVKEEYNQIQSQGLGKYAYGMARGAAGALPVVGAPLGYAADRTAESFGLIPKMTPNERVDAARLDLLPAAAGVAKRGFSRAATSSLSTARDLRLRAQGVTEGGIRGSVGNPDITGTPTFLRNYETISKEGFYDDFSPGDPSLRGSRIAETPFGKNEVTPLEIPAESTSKDLYVALSDRARKAGEELGAALSLAENTRRQLPDVEGDLSVLQSNLSPAYDRATKVTGGKRAGSASNVLIGDRAEAAQIMSELEAGLGEARGDIQKLQILKQEYADKVQYERSARTSNSKASFKEDIYDLVSRGLDATIDTLTAKYGSPGVGKLNERYGAYIDSAKMIVPKLNRIQATSTSARVQLPLSGKLGVPAINLPLSQSALDRGFLSAAKGAEGAAAGFKLSAKLSDTLNDSRALLALNSLSRQAGITNPSINFEELPPALQQQMYDVIKRNFSNWFTKPVEGYFSLGSDGRLKDPVEIDLHKRMALDSSIPESQKAMVFNGINDAGRYVSIQKDPVKDDIEALGKEAQTSGEVDVSSFAKLLAEAQSSSLSGVPSRSSTDLGPETAQMLRSMEAHQNEIDYDRSGL